MKSFFLQNLIILIIPALLFSCKKNDPISNSEFGEITTESFLTKLKNNEGLEIILGNESPYDTIYSYSINNKQNLNSTLWVNPDEYSFDTLYSIKLNLGTDSVLFLERKKYAPGKGDFRKSKLDSITNLYIEWYGEPSYTFSHYELSTKINEVDSLFKDKKILSEKKSDIAAFFVQGSNINYIVWTKEKVNIMISYILNENDNIVSNGFVKYETKNYDEVLNTKRELIRKNASLNEYLSLEFYLGEFSNGTPPYTDRLNFTMNSFSHNLPEEPRNIKNFKFDVIFENEYKDTILTVKDLEYDGFGLLVSAYSRGFSSSPAGEVNYYVDYYRYNENGVPFEELRKLRERKALNRNLRDIKISYTIKSIVFENGDIIK